MSMLRTLQHNPGTISLFNSAKSSTSLLSSLQFQSIGHHEHEEHAKSLWERITKGKKDDHEEQLYVIDSVPESHLPTFDQIKLIKSYTSEDSQNLNVFKSVFPNFINSDGKVSIIDQTAYGELLKEKQHDWFKPPLIVDWDKKKLANDVKTLQELLKQYK